MNFVKKKLILILLVCLIANVSFASTTAYAFSVGDILGQTTQGSNLSALSDVFIGLLLEKLLGPLIHSTGDKTVPVPPSGDSAPANDNSKQDNTKSSAIKGKIIVIDPGHGGSNPGAVANNSTESSNNLAVGLKLQNLLVQAGAKVIMTRDTDRTVAPEGSTLGEELQARVDLAEAKHADIFVSLHSNSNPDSSIEGAMTFYHGEKSPDLASQIQKSLIKATGATDKGIAKETFYVLRNTSMPGVLVEMGFVSNANEAAKLKSESYRDRLATGVFNGIGNYFSTKG